MAITLAAPACQASCDGIVNQIDIGSSAGALVIWKSAVGAEGSITTATTNVLVIIPFGDPAFGDASAAAPSVATANAIAAVNATGAGTAAVFSVYKVSAGTYTELFRGAVGTSGSDLNITNLTIALGDPITITSFTFSVPA